MESMDKGKLERLCDWLNRPEFDLFCERVRAEKGYLDDRLHKLVGTRGVDVALRHEMDAECRGAWSVWDNLEHLPDLVKIELEDAKEAQPRDGAGRSTQGDT